MIKKICLGVPLSWPYVPALFLISFYEMLKKSIPKYDINLIVISKSLVELMREEIAQRFMAGDSEALVWLDADQTYPAQTINQLVGLLDGGLEIVGGLTADRSGDPLIFDYNEPEGNGRQKLDFKPGQGVIKIDIMGMAGVAMTRSALEKTGPPWFESMKNKLGKPMGEDFSFFIRCRNAGVDVWLDSDLVFGHIATLPIYPKGGNNGKI